MYSVPCCCARVLFIPFLLEADHVFLVHAKHLMQKLKRYALLYSMFLSLIKWGALAVLLFPLWRQYGDCTLPAYSGMFCCLFGFHTAILAVHRHRKNSRRTFGNQAAGWLKVMVLMAGAFFYDRLCRRMVLALAGGMYIVHLFRSFDLERIGDIISL